MSSTVTLPGLTLASTVPDGAPVVVGYDGSSLQGLPSKTAKKWEKAGDLAAAAAMVGAGAKLAETTVLPGPDGAVVLVGLGESPADLSPEQLRRAAGAGLRRAAKLGTTTVTLALPAGEAEQVQAIAEGALLASYSYTPITASPEKSALTAITVVASADAATASTAATVAEAVCVAREWVNIPANLLYPETFASAIKEHLRGTKADVEILDDTQLAKGGYGGLMAVGGGSDRKPRLVRASYAPRGAKAHLVLVGKGITFDSGGLDIKPPAGMYTMKCDMGGAAAVVAALGAIASLGLKIKVTAYACLAENMPSGSAYRPSDVLTMYGGTTVENVNTDAEGRLVMADGLARGTEDKPDVIIDVATLTGAAVVGLGESDFGVLGNDDELVDRILAAAESAGEGAWPLRIGEDADERLASSVADLKSGDNKSRGAGTQMAAAFLRRFVGDHTWGHLDIAPTAYNTGGPKDYTPEGGTGSGVRTLVKLAQSLAG
ncbi:leucyl aminopeptidase [Parenemella sanctibonifatiensis]|uniref:Probable cytosol aminopeptidase n=1 Tax=Parenemella sanctibonifatiensis TaxID=2016505 RepID=A0A255EDZ8_9ACTN|nr:leucyl aminopeptidase [Parenemella sanctibonifatiensis]OYN89618.1 leucyl aminopeptidase [Parenemella sanctibonifatiensis]OYN89774.1 leucyl aminopeptidase [Parenemella sanctibonifatiensis]